MANNHNPLKIFNEKFWYMVIVILVLIMIGLIQNLSAEKLPDETEKEIIIQKPKPKKKSKYNPPLPPIKIENKEEYEIVDESETKQELA